MKNKKQWLSSLMVLFFCIIAFGSVIPKKVWNTYNVNGKADTYTVADHNSFLVSDENQSTIEKKQIVDYNGNFNSCGIVILFLGVVVLSFVYRILKKDTMVTLKVRMNN